MSTFECKVYRLEIEEHPNADRLELAKVGDYRSIVGKGDYKTGDLGVYIPEAALAPEWILEKLGLVGKLAGKQHNRVKAAKFRGVLSQGLVYPIKKTDTERGVPGYLVENSDGWRSVELGEDVQEFLGIEKYEPIIPSCMKGELQNAFGCTLKYDIENLKKHPGVIADGEIVVCTEKLHGTWTCFGYHPEYEEKEPYLVTSKGLADHGLAFKLNDANSRNLYIRALRATEDADGNNVIDRVRAFLIKEYEWENAPVYILGETYGPGVQKNFHYGLLKPFFRVFDVYVGAPGKGRYLTTKEIYIMSLSVDFERVPQLYFGPFSQQMVEMFTSGAETVSGKDDHMREGMVIRTATERTDERIQAEDSNTPHRVILKSVSEEYLLLKGGTEYT